MQILVISNGQQKGPFSVEQIKAGLQSGTLSPSDMAWHEGRSNWTAIETFLVSLAAPPPPPPNIAAQSLNTPLPPPVAPYVPVARRFSEALKSAGRTQQIILGVCLLLTLGVVGFTFIGGRISIFGPTNEQVEIGITYSLSQRINGNGPLFSSYKVINKYTKKVNGEKWYIYEFEAICGINDFGTNKDKTFSGTTSLTKRGSKWSYLTKPPQ